jgi:peptidoglycan hydrolase CwlO-like protein
MTSALQERMDKMNEQLNILDVIRKEKNDYKRELERLHYKVKDLNKHIDKYREEIARLEEEKETLNDKVMELETLVAKRDEEI